MDPHGNIYEDENVPAEDAARLDDYLRARAEADEKMHAEYLQERVARMEAKPSLPSPDPAEMADRLQRRSERILSLEADIGEACKRWGAWCARAADSDEPQLWQAFVDAMDTLCARAS
jgi:bacterioferritin (cytochrome b1)